MCQYSFIDTALIPTHNLFITSSMKGLTMRLLFMSLIAFAAVACANLPPQYKNPPKNTKLDPAAAKVRIVEFLSTSEKDQYDESEMLSCALGMNMTSTESNMTACNNYFKNEAHTRGSSLVLIKPEHKRIGMEAVNTGAQTVQCGNCVDMKAIVLVAKPTKTKKK